VTLRIIEGEGGCTFYVRVVPRGRRDKIVGVHGDALKIRLTAPPVKGKANRALRKFLADCLGVSRSDVEILSGHTSRQKRVRVHGVAANAIHALLSVE